MPSCYQSCNLCVRGLPIRGRIRFPCRYWWDLPASLGSPTDTLSWEKETGNGRCPRNRCRCTCIREALVRCMGCNEQDFRLYPVRRICVEKEESDRGTNRMCDIDRDYRLLLLFYLKRCSRNLFLSGLRCRNHRFRVLSDSVRPGRGWWTKRRYGHALFLLYGFWNR